MDKKLHIFLGMWGPVSHSAMNNEWGSRNTLEIADYGADMMADGGSASSWIVTHTFRWPPTPLRPSANLRRSGDAIHMHMDNRPASESQHGRWGWAHHHAGHHRPF